MDDTHISMRHALKGTIRRRTIYLANLVVCQKESSKNTQNFPSIERNGKHDLDKDEMVFFCQNKWVSLKGIHIGWMLGVGFMCFFSSNLIQIGLWCFPIGEMWRPPRLLWGFLQFQPGSCRNTQPPNIGTHPTTRNPSLQITLSFGPSVRTFILFCYCRNLCTAV